MTKILVTLIAVLGLAMPAQAKSNRQKKQEARVKCLKEKPSLKGKELKRCIRKNVN